MKPRIAVPYTQHCSPLLWRPGSFGHTRVDVAESAAECMGETHDLRACSKPEGSMWVFVAVFALVGGFVGVVGYIVGQRESRAGNHLP